MIILAIDTSFDDTAAAVVHDTQILSNVLSTQLSVHEQYGGIVPNLARESHKKYIDPVIALALKKRGVVIFGISADSVESHKAFAEKFHLIFPLLADTEKKVIEAYGVWGEKEMAGKKYMGIRRMSFLIDPEGKIAKIYEKVNAEEHPEEVLKDLENLQ
jgi:hypothetical protein